VSKDSKKDKKDRRFETDDDATRFIAEKEDKKKKER
jgi:hypothetical protein